MTYDVYRYIFYAGAILAAIMFVVSLILFIVLKIPAVIGDLSGATAKKAIENIRNQNEESGEKTYKSSAVNRERGRLTDKISPSGSLHNVPSDKLGFGMKTEKISTQRLDIEETGNEITILGASNETTLLSSNVGEIEVLNEAPAYNETTLLSQDMLNTNGVGFGDTCELPPLPACFEIEKEITFIHTNEVITLG